MSLCRWFVLLISYFLKRKGYYENPLQHDFDFISAHLLMSGVAYSGSLRFASTWRELYLYDIPRMGQNLLMPLGFYSLGIEMIGLIVLWTAYRRKERWAWFVMLIILFSFIFPVNVLTPFLTLHTWGSVDWSLCFQYIREGNWPSIWVIIGFFDFLIMLVALLLPIKAFFWSRPVVQVKVESPHEQA